MVLAPLLAIGLALATPTMASTTTTPQQPATAQQPTAGGDRAAIIGGRAATEAYPFMVSFRLGARPEHHCGGSLVAADWVVTAAHCKGLFKPGRTLVRVGSADRDQGGVLTSVRRAITHPEWGRRGVGGEFEADITLVQLNRPVELEPIRIADGPGPVGEPTRVIGWGMVCEDTHDPACAKGSRHLRELDTVRVPDSRCSFLQKGRELCTGERQGRAASACSGDSGGPQIRRVSGRWELIGATSRDGDDVEDRRNGSAGCSTSPDGGPGVGIWTDVTHYRTWISDTIAKESRSSVAAS
ncbi:S1 family peptidase [Nonomuraea lactucae]|uniref:S1 family peptidase n=1 Tax=Nonomuraea lactucae TaxID=2249762 RepID=UPI0013B39EEA|nr:serine protease [Nonomuraea lactucae]